MVLRPLSQTGLRRIAKNAKQRPILEGGAPAKRTLLDAFNDKADDCYLHATKGWRLLSVKRSIATMIAAEIQRGMHWSTDAIRDQLKSVR